MWTLPLKGARLLANGNAFEAGRWVKMPLHLELYWAMRDILVTPLLLALLLLKLAYKALGALRVGVPIEVWLALLFTVLFCACTSKPACGGWSDYEHCHKTGQR